MKLFNGLNFHFLDSMDNDCTVWSVIDIENYKVSHLYDYKQFYNVQP